MSFHPLGFVVLVRKSAFLPLLLLTVLTLTVSTRALAQVPTITSFTPTSAAAGTSVMITGTGFSGANSVTFDGTPASSYTVVSSTSINATIALTTVAGYVTVSVGNLSGTATTGATLFIQPPIIQSMSPTSGPVGTVVTLTGIAFSGVTSVQINSQNTVFTIVSPTSITLTIPTGATTGVIALGSPGAYGPSPSNFTVIPPPTITSFTPTSGPPANVVALVGTNFSNATAVKFNSVAATTFTVNSATLISATIPTTATTGTISVTTPGGTATSSSSFTVLAPSVVTTILVSPSSAVLVEGGTQQFTAIADDQYGNPMPTQPTFTWTLGTGAIGSISSSGLYTAGSATGTDTVKATVGSVVSSNPVTVYVTIPAPIVSSFTPSIGVRGSTVTVSGSYFTGASAVSFNGVPSASYTILSASSLTAVVPPTATTGPISVTRSGLTASSSASFAVIMPPVISSFSPSSGIIGSTVSLSGTGFTGATSVTLNGVTVSTFSVVSGTSLTFTVPTGAATGTITVTSPAGTGTSSTSYTVIPPPTITSFTPTSIGAGSTLIITGTGFTGTTAVAIAGTAATFTVTNSTTISATVSLSTNAGNSTITVTTPNGVATSTSQIFVQPPGIQSISPTSGPVGTAVTLTGYDFLAVSSVNFGSYTAPSSVYTIVNSTTITTTVPAGAATGQIWIWSPGAIGPSAATFTVIPTTTLTSISPSSGPVGTTVTLTGQSFTGATNVSFNGVAASSFTVTSDTSMTAVVPVGATTGTVSVTSPGGTATSPTSFTVTPTLVLTTISVTPNPVTVSYGGTQQFTATGLDQNSNALSSQPSFSWFMGFEPIGSISTSGLYTAGATAGTDVVTASSGTITGSASVNVTAPLPSTPTNLTAGPVGSGVQLNWTPVSGATTYHVYRGTTSGGEGPTPINSYAGTSNYTDISGTSGVTYYYQVTAVGSTGQSGKSNEASAVYSAAQPPGPQFITAKAVGAQNVISWSAVSGATSYNLYRFVAQTVGSIAPYRTGLTATTYSDSSVTNGVTYQYCVTAVTSSGESSQSPTVSVTAGDPSTPIPTGLAATPSGSSIALTWNASSGATTYNIYRANASGSEGSIPVASSSSPYYTDYSPLSGTDYYEVTSVSIAGESGKSVEVSAQPAGSIAAPGLISAIAGTSLVTVSWSSVTGATSYNLYRSVGLGSGNPTLYQAGLTSASYADTSVTNGQTYGYQVAAVSSAGQSGVSVTVYAVPGGTPPPAPAWLKATPYGTNQIQLTWAPVGGSQFNPSFYIYRSTSSHGEGSVPVATAGAANTYTDSPNPTGSTTYYYQVSTVTTPPYIGTQPILGEGPKSNEAIATTGATVLAAPATINAVPSSGSVAVTWSSVTGATSYVLNRGVGTGTVAPYILGITSTSYTDSAVTNGVSYTYSVSTASSAGVGSASTAVSATPGGASAPSAPIGLTAQPSGSASVSLTWNVVIGATGYNVYRSTTSGGEGGTALASVTPSSSALLQIPYYDSSGLTSGTNYYYKVTAYNGTGEGAKSGEAEAQPGGTVLAAPTNIAAVPGSNSVTLNWSSVPLATSYAVYREVLASYNPYPDYDPYVGSTTTTSYVDSSAVNGVTYQYNLVAINAVGASPLSAAVYATPGGTVPVAPVDLVASSTSSSFCKLTWNAVASALSYNVYRSSTSGGEGAVPIASVTASTSGVWTYSDTNGLTAGAHFYYEVTAVNDVGESVKSNEAAVIIGSSPAAPAQISAIAGNSQVSINWSTVTGATSYDLYRNVSLGAFSVYQSGLSSPSYIDTGLTNGISYGYYAVATSSGGTSPASLTASAIPGDALIPAPTNLTVTQNVASPVLNWVAPNGVGSSGTFFNVYRGTVPGGEGNSPIGSTTTWDTTTYTDSTALPNSIYFYEVSAVSNGLEGARSNEASTITAISVTTGFALVPDPVEMILAPGGKCSIVIAVPGASNFSGPVNFAVTGAPTGVQAWCYGASDIIDPTTHYGGGTDLWFTVSPSTAAGSYQITLTGTAGSSASYPFTCTLVVTLVVT